MVFQGISSEARRKKRELFAEPGYRAAALLRLCLFAFRGRPKKAPGYFMIILPTAPGGQAVHSAFLSR